MRDLAEIREEIDGIDAQIAALFEKRLGLVSQVAEYKIANGKPVLDRERELSKLKRLEGMAATPFSRKSLRELFEQIMAVCRKRQYQLLAEAGQTVAGEFQPVEGLKLDGVRVVYQGVEGAYSQMAMQEFFGEACDAFHVETWRDAMEAIAEGMADYAVLPIENSSAGIVNDNYDLLQEFDNYIVGEGRLRGSAH